MIKVKELMTQKVKTVTPEDSVEKVFLFFNFQRIRHLPVIEKKKIMGMFSDRDLKKVMGSLKIKKEISEKGQLYVAIKQRKVKSIMKRGVLTTPLNAEVFQAAAIVVKRRKGKMFFYNNEL